MQTVLHYRYKIIAFLCFFAKKHPELCRQPPLSCKQRKAVLKELPFSEISTIGEILFTFSS